MVGRTTRAWIWAGMIGSGTAAYAQDAGDATKERPADVPAAAPSAEAAPAGAAPAEAAPAEPAPAAVEVKERPSLDMKALHAYNKSIGRIGIREDEPALLADGTSVEVGALKLTFEDGYFFPVFSGQTEAEWAEDDAEKGRGEDKDEDEDEDKDEDKDKDEDETDDATGERGRRQAVGYVFVGSGQIEMKWGEPRFARDVANHLVRDLDRPESEVAGWVAGDPVKANMTQGLVLSADPKFEAFLAGLPQVAPEGTVASDLGRRDPVVVPEAAAFEKAKKAAVETWEDRTDLYGDFLKVKGWLQQDRLYQDKLDLGPDTSRVVIDFLTDTRFGQVSGKKGGNPDGDRWLTQVHDPRGWHEGKSIDDVFSMGSKGGSDYFGNLNAIHFPPSKADDPLSPPLPTNRWAPLTVDQTVEIGFTRDQFNLEGEVTQLIKVKGEGPLPPRVVRIEVPKYEEVKDSWAFLGFTLEDGTPCLTLDPEDKAFKDLSGSMGCLLPYQPATGEEITLKVVTKGTFPYANLLPGDSVEVMGSLGQSTGLQMIVPSLTPGLGGGAFTVTHRVGVPVDSKLVQALSGFTKAEWEEDGMRWVEAQTDDTALYPGFAVGAWRTVQVPSLEGLPAIKVHLFDKDLTILKGFPPEMRRVVALYQQFLPPFPWTEMELFQAPDMFYGYMWIAPHGMVNLQQTRVFNEGGAEGAFREGTPHMESGVLAHEIAHQYWGHTVRASHISEGWVNETMSESFSMLFVGSAYGAQDFGARVDKYRELWEEDVPDGETASMVRAYESRLQPQIVYNYGPYVMHAMLRRRIGDEPFFRSIDQFVRDHYKQPISSEQFVDAFVDHAPPEYTAAQVRDFFDYWVYGGYIPDEVAVTWSVEGSKIVGEVRSDVPFGTMDVPVRIIESKDSVRDILVTVKDGEGSFESPDLTSPDTCTVELDPNGMILTHARKVKKL